MRNYIWVLVALLTSIATFAQTQSDTISVRGHHGMLSVIVQHPTLKKGKKCDAIILMHGFTGHKNEPIVSTLARKLGQLGYATIRFDFNGHGESEGLFQEMTVPNEIVDALSIFHHVRALPYVDRIAFVGHSQGGVVSSMTAGKLGTDSVSAVALMAPAAVLRDDAIRGNTMGAQYDPLNLKSDYVTLPGGRLKLGKCYIESAFSLPIYETAAMYQGPAFIIHGTGDRIVPYTYGERYAQIWTKAQVSIIPRENHGFTRNLDDATQQVVDFLHKTLSK